MSIDQFPIMGRWDGRRQIPATSIPWAMLAPHEPQAMRNHNQSLRRLAERGGLGVCEAVAILQDRPWHRMESAVAIAQLVDLVAKWEVSE